MRQLTRDAARKIMSVHRFFIGSWLALSAVSVAVAPSAFAQDQASEPVTAESHDMTTTVETGFSEVSPSESAAASTLQTLSDKAQARRIDALVQQQVQIQTELTAQKQRNRQLYIALGGTGLLLFGAALLAWRRHRAVKALERDTGEVANIDISRSEFLNVMSHEMRTRLNGIIGLSDFLAAHAPSQDVRQKNEIILRSGNELLGLVNNILEMNLIEQGELTLQPEYTDIKPILKSCGEYWRKFIEPKGVTFTQHIDPSVPIGIKVDAARFKQCVDHLLSNAVKFTTEGRIHMHVVGEVDEAGQAEIKLIIADTGAGMSQEVQARLFQPFVPPDIATLRQSGGTGLGLAITRELARMMSGDVSVNSNSGRGSEFTLTIRGEVAQASQLPYIEPPTEAVDVDGPAEPEPVTGEAGPSFGTSEDDLGLPRRILVVEDDVASQDVVRALLEPAGCKLICVPNGNFALEALRENLFDVILMDIRMPALDGIQTTREIRNGGKAYADIPIIAVTADVAPETRTKCQVAGVDMFLEKPINAKALFDAFDQIGLIPAKAKSA